MFSFKGRINRTTFLLGGLIYAVLTAPFYFLQESSTSPYDDKAWFTAAVLGLLVLLLWTIISLHIRRLHDLGLSGWFLPIILLPFVSVMLLFLPGKESTQYGPKPTKLFDVARLFER